MPSARPVVLDMLTEVPPEATSVYSPKRPVVALVPLNVAVYPETDPVKVSPLVKVPALLSGSIATLLIGFTCV